MTTTSTRARYAALPLLLASAIGLSACGGGSSTTTNASAGSGAAATGTTGGQGGAGGRGGYGAAGGGQTTAERTKLQACLKKQGVSLPTRPGGGQGGPGGGAPPAGTATNGAPPTSTDGAPPTSTNGAPPAGAGGAGGLPGAGGRRGGFGGANQTPAQRQKLPAALKACGADFGGGARGGQGGAQRPNTNSAAYRKSIEAYVTCVRKNGYDLPAPNFSGTGPIFDAKKVDQTSAKFKKASAACQSKLMTGRPQAPQGATGASGSTTSSTS